jgi:hypothetical protein
LASALFALPFGQCIVCSSFWPVYFLLNTLAKRKSRQCTDQKEEQTMHWPKGRADKVPAKRKSRQYTDQKEEQTMHWPKGRAGQFIVCSSF